MRFSEFVAPAMDDKKNSMIIGVDGNIIKNFGDNLFVWGPCSEGFMTISSKKNGKYGYCNKQGHIIIKPSYDSVSEFSSGYAAVMISNKYGYIDHNEIFHVSPQYDYARDYCEGMAAVQYKGKWGYLNLNGILAISNKYSLASDFMDGKALVELNGNKIIDKSGNILKDCENWNFPMQGFREGKLIVCSKTTTQYCANINSFIDTYEYSCLNKNMKIDFTIFCEQLNSYNEGLARIKIDGHWGFIDLLGNMVISNKYDVANDFSENLAYVRLGDDGGFIDKLGNWVVKLTDSK